MKLTFFQKILSFIFPVKVETAPGTTTPVLGLYRFQGRWQLSSATALYSDGAAYRPLKVAFTFLKKELQGIRSMLVLGAGLGSAVAVVQKMNINIAATTLVDIDPQVISWGKQTIPLEIRDKCKWVCADVRDFVSSQTGFYDLVIIDVFQDRIVPGFVTTHMFLEKCRLLTKPDSFIIINYIINNEAKWEEAFQEIGKIFSIAHVISIGINRILILRNNA